MEALETLIAEPGGGLPLPAQLRDLYGGDFALPAPTVYSNFVSSLDGVVALGQPGLSSGPAISGRSEADRFVMGLLRACADCVLVGASTVRDDPGVLWTASFIYPPQREAYSELRRALGLSAEPELAIVTASGDLDPTQPALKTGAVVLTTAPGAARLGSRAPVAAEIVELAGERLAMSRVLAELRRRGHRRILCEGGPRVIGELLRERALDEIFLTLSPVLAGRDGAERPGMVSGVELLPAAGAWARLVSARRHGSHLFLRYSIRRDG